MSKIFSINEVAVLNESSIKSTDSFDFINYLDTGNLTKNNIDGYQLLKNNLPSRAKRKIKKNTILYSTVRPNQEHYGIFEKIDANKNIIVSTGFTTIDVFHKDVVPKYLYYRLTQKEITNYLQTIAENSVSAYPSIKPSDIGELNFRFPDATIQQRIASVLSSLDDKIELNNRINTELEAMAKTLYDYWFVQFDFPNANGKPYKSAGGKMAYNEELKREIPKGWEVETLFESSYVQYGFPFSTDYFNEEKKGVPVIRIRDILENSVSCHSTEANIDNRYLLEIGDLLIGMDGNFHINHWSLSGCFLNQRCVRFRKKLLNTGILKYQIEPYIKLREKSVSRTTVGHLSDKDLKTIRLIIPSRTELDNFNACFESLLEKKLKNRQENQHLASLRDWLLPMLMNGQVGFKEEDKKQKQVVNMTAEVGHSIRYTMSQTALLAGYIIFKNTNQDFGRTKLMKLLFLVEYHCQLSIDKRSGQQYYKNTAGPHNDEYIKEVENMLTRYGFYTIQKEARSIGKDIVRYQSNNRDLELQHLFQESFSEKKKAIDTVINLMKKYSWSVCEIIATLYAVWNNRILNKESINDNLLVQDFYSWSKHKHDYLESEVLAGLGLMRKNNIVPIGFGEYVGKKAKSV